MNEVKKSVIVDKSVEKLEESQFTVSTEWIIIFLVVMLVVLKKFIYIKDDKRDGK